MFACLLKRQWKRCVLLIAFFCFVLFMQQRSDWEFTGMFYEDQQTYMQQYALSDRAVFFDGLKADMDQSAQVVKAIDAFEGYDGQMVQGYVDIIDILSGTAYYADYDMVVWREQMLSLPGRFTQTVSYDKTMTQQLYSRLSNQREFEDIIENHREIMRRGIRRGSVNTPKYEAAAEQLSRISGDFSVTDTLQTGRLIEYISGDWYILVLLCLCFFTVFSGAAQGRITNQVLISKVGVRRYTLGQLAVSSLLLLLCLLLYYAGATFACCNGALDTYAWNLPIQAVKGSWFNGATIVLDLKVWQYVLALIGLKSLFCFVLVSVVLLISVLSKNNIISAIGSLALCGGLLLVHGARVSGSILIGDGSWLLDDLCWVILEDTAVPYTALYVPALLVLALVINSVTVLVSPPMARKWVK